jgi:outer membrane protein assembly factor BamB
MKTKIFVSFLLGFFLFAQGTLAQYAPNYGYTYKGNFQRSGSYPQTLSDTASLVSVYSLGYPIKAFFALDRYLLLGDKDHRLLRYDPDYQRILWTSEFSYADLSHPTLWEDQLFFGTRNGRIVCLAWKTGQQIWNNPLFAHVSSAPLMVGDQVVFGSSDGLIYALNKFSGRTNWIFNAESAVIADLAELNGLIFAGTIGGRCLTLNSLGRLIWEHHIHGTITEAPAVHKDYFAVSTYEGILYCFNQDGSLRWHKINQPFISSSPIIQNGEVYQFFPDGYLRSYHMDTGEMNLSIYVESPRQTPILTAKTMIFRLWNGVLKVDIKTQASQTYIFQEGFDVQSMVLSGKNIYLLMKTGEIFRYTL